MPRGFFGRPRRNGMRNSASELEGCLGLKIGNDRCSLGCVLLFLLAGAVTAIVVLVLKFGLHMF